ncbi:hypothetical protein [Microbacterium sp. K5D]|uniref:hypothetical protein n=1 Tax=Microbacterium sp. K5D TaxID=2305436 RepID=UPI00109C3E97|nr:hypothetical protein [Microbacterium sp. K5D]
MAAPTLTAYVDAAPCPRVEVFFPSFVAGTASVTVYRLAGGREQQMRGAVSAPTGGTLTRIDFEVPFNRVVSYRAEQFDAGGQSLGFTPAGTITVPSGVTWMHNPLNPDGAVRVQLGGDSALQVSRPTPGVVSRPKGRRVGVVLSEPRQGVSGLLLHVLTFTDAEADAVQAMFGDAGMPPVVCVRLGADYGVMRVPQPLFLSALSVSEDDINYQWGGGELSHRVEGDEVDPPIPGLFIPLLTREDLNVSFATRSALNAGGLTRADINRLYQYAGAAG